MDNFSPEISETVRRFSDDEQSGEHLAAQQIADYHSGKLSAQAHDAARAHLVQCRECTQLLLDLADFANLTPPEEAEAITEGDFSTLRDSLSDCFEATNEESSEEDLAVVSFPISQTISKSVPRKRVRTASRYAQWVAAAAALGTIAVGTNYFWRSSPQGFPVEPSGGSTTSPTSPRMEFFPLFPDATRSASEKTIRLEDWADAYALGLGSTESPEYPAAWVMIRDLDGTIYRALEQIPRGQDGTYNYLLSRDDLPNGQYEILLFKSGDAVELLEKYTIRLIIDAP